MIQLHQVAEALAVDPAREITSAPPGTLQQFIFQISTENVFNESPKHGVQMGLKTARGHFHHTRCSGNPLEASSYSVWLVPFTTHSWAD